MLQGLLYLIPMQYMILALIIVLSINLIAFAMMGIDKRKARKHKHRISERALLTVAFLGGSMGILLGMAAFHHKISNARHPAFTKGVPIILLSEMILILLAISILA